MEDFEAKVSEDEFDYRDTSTLRARSTFLAHRNSSSIRGGHFYDFRKHVVLH